MDVWKQHVTSMGRRPRKLQGLGQHFWNDEAKDPGRANFLSQIHAEHAFASVRLLGHASVCVLRLSATVLTVTHRLRSIYGITRLHLPGESGGGRVGEPGSGGERQHSVVLSAAPRAAARSREAPQVRSDCKPFTRLASGFQTGLSSTSRRRAVLRRNARFWSCWT